MKSEIRVPASEELGSDITLVVWHKKSGDTVERGEVVAEIEADKGLLEIEAVESGTLGEIIKREGETCEPGEVIGTIKQSLPDKTPQTAVKAAPAARRLAAESGVSLEEIGGTGPDGLITVHDVEQAAAGKAGAGAEKPAESQLSTKSSAAGAGDIPVELSFNQRLVFGAVERSNREIPTVRFAAAINMARAMKEKESLGVRYDALYLHAVGQVIMRHRSFLRYCVRGTGNSLSVYQRGRCNVALAVAQKERLYTPAFKDVDRKSPEEIEEEIEDTVWKIVEGSWKSDKEPGGEGCMLLSNLGMFPVTHFDALVYPGQSAALAIGQIEEKAVVSEGGINVLPVCTATIAIDHRIVNGKDAAEFLQDLKRLLETGDVKPNRKGKIS